MIFTKTDQVNKKLSAKQEETKTDQSKLKELNGVEKENYYWFAHLNTEL